MAEQQRSDSGGPVDGCIHRAFDSGVGGLDRAAGAARGLTLRAAHLFGRHQSSLRKQRPRHYQTLRRWVRTIFGEPGHQSDGARV